MSSVSRASHRTARDKRPPRKQFRISRDARNVERQADNLGRADLGEMRPWDASRRNRKMRRAQDDRVQQQQRNGNGMIMYIDKETGGMRLKFDTEKARREALVRSSLEAEEQAAINLEKRKAAAKREAAKKTRRDPGEVTVTKKDTKPRAQRKTGAPAKKASE